MRTYTPERSYSHQGHSYVFRDVLENGEPIRCEYKVKSRDGSEVWKQCEEGSEFSQVEPFQAVA